MSAEPISVIVAMDFSDAIMEGLRAISPRLRIERHYPNVPDRAWADAEILYTLHHFPLPAQVPRLRWIQLHTAGIDHAAKEAIMHAQDVEITTSSGVHAVAMSEYTLGMMLAFSLRLPLMLDYQRRAEWSPDRHKIFSPIPLRGQTLGIVGYGAVGRELARAADALGMRVLATKRDVRSPADHDAYREPNTGDPEGEIPARLYPPEATVSMARECDFLVVIAPSTSATRHMINQEVFDAMKRTAVLVNIGRGATVDEAALISALAAGKLAGAALDVFEEEPLPPGSPLWNLDNVIISPHVSGVVRDYHQRVATLFGENLRRYLDNQPLFNRVNRERGY
jgi:phosphoglycerate dehydrogenase-like enzyme